MAVLNVLFGLFGVLLILGIWTASLGMVLVPWASSVGATALRLIADRYRPVSLWLTCGVLAQAVVAGGAAWLTQYVVPLDDLATVGLFGAATGLAVVLGWSGGVLMRYRPRRGAFPPPPVAENRYVYVGG